MTDTSLINDPTQVRVQPSNSSILPPLTSHLKALKAPPNLVFTRPKAELTWHLKQSPCGVNSHISPPSKQEGEQMLVNMSSLPHTTSPRGFYLQHHLRNGFYAACQQTPFHSSSGQCRSAATEKEIPLQLFSLIHIPPIKDLYQKAVKKKKYIFCAASHICKSSNVLKG